HNFDHATPDLRSNILSFYSDPSAPLATKKKPADWKKTEDEVERLRDLSTFLSPSGSGGIRR
ncbi:MAG: hypothetical protein WBQ87_17285, partial [Candidatus Sulfotelmatobacter sp.]